MKIAKIFIRLYKYTDSLSLSMQNNRYSKFFRKQNLGGSAHVASEESGYYSNCSANFNQCQDEDDEHKGSSDHHHCNASLCSIQKKQAKCCKHITRALKEINDKQKATHLIYRSDVGNAGYRITAPGVYQLAEDIEFDPTSPYNAVPVTFSGGGGGTGASAFAAVSGGVVRGIIVASAGTGYLTPPTASIGGTGTGALAGTVVLTGTGVAQVPVTAGGTGYANTVVAAISIASSNVILILGDKRLSQAGVDFTGNVSPSQRPFVVGIVVEDVFPAFSGIMFLYNSMQMKSLFASNCKGT